MLEPSRPRQRWRRIALALALGCVLVECAFRAYVFLLAPSERQGKLARMDQMPASAFRFRPHPYFVYALNESFASSDGRNRHNAHGCRGADFAMQKATGTTRIVCIGGSTTYETGVEDDKETYPAQLGELLRTQHGHPEVEVINAGVPGYTSWESLLWLELVVLEWQPDLVLYYDNTNDVHPRLVEPEVYRSDDAGYRRPWDDDVRWWDHSLVVRWLGVQSGFSPRNALVDRATREENVARDPEAALRANDPRWFRRNLELMAAVCRARGAELVLASWAWCPAKGDFAGEELYQRAFAENNAVLEEVAREQGLAWLDVRAQMPTDPKLWRDGAHVNPGGALRKAEIFAALLAPILLQQDAGLTAATPSSVHLPALAHLGSSRTDSSGNPMSPRPGSVVDAYPLTPSREQLDQLESAFGRAALFGWELETRVAGTLALELEDARTGRTHGRVELALHPGSLESIVAVVEDPALGETGTPTLRISFHRIVGEELVLLLQGAEASAGARDDDELRPGWNRHYAEFYLLQEGDRSRVPVDVLSWNGGMSSTDALHTLAEGRFGGMWTKSAVADLPLASWPRPLWVVFASFERK